MALTSSPTNYKFARKKATLLALVTAKHCNDLTLLHFDNQHQFPQHHYTIFIPASDGKMDLPGHDQHQILIESYSNVSLCPVFHLKAYLCCTEPFTENLDGSYVSCLFLSNNS